jgi:hypothetical protein
MYQFWARALGGLGEGPVPWRLPLFGLLASRPGAKAGRMLTLGAVAGE